MRFCVYKHWLYVVIITMLWIQWKSMRCCVSPPPAGAAMGGGFLPAMIVVGGVFIQRAVVGGVLSGCLPTGAAVGGVCVGSGSSRRM